MSSRSFLTALAGIFLLAEISMAQPWMDGLTEKDRGNFRSIQKAFEEYWKDRDTREKGKGWKAFKRWEWYWEQRTFPDGEFPDRSRLFDEYKRITLDRATRASIPRANWSELGPSSATGGYSGIGRINCVHTDPSDTDIIWVGSAAGGLWKSTDAGISWSTMTDTLLSLGVTDIAIDPGNTNVMYLATGDGDASDDYSIGVLKSTDGGTSWMATGLSWQTSEASLLSRLLMHPDNPDILIAGGSGIFLTTDGGLTWTQTNTTRIYDLEFKPGDPNTIYASGANSNVFRSTDGGITWPTMSSGFPTNGRRVALGVSVANPEYIYALLSNASYGFLGVYRSTNGGNSWSARSTTPNILGWEVNGSDAGGQGWYDLALAVSPVNAEEIFTGGVNIWKSTTGGASWSISSMWYYIPGIAEVHADQHNLFFAPGTSTLFAGNDGGVYRTTDLGATWSWIGSGLRVTQFYRFGTSQTDPDRIIAGSQDNGTKSVNNGVWSDELGGDGMEALIDYSDENIMYGELYYGDMYRSMNGGSTWTSATGGITESGGWITPYVIHPTNPSTLFAGYSHVWKTTNRGVSWSIISNIALPLSILAIAPSDPNVLYAGSGSILYRTTDGGETNWTLISRPTGAGSTTSIAVHPADPYRIWMSSSGYLAGQKVFESTDGGMVWTNISGGLPNIPVNCIVYQNNSPNRIYVGTDLGVYYRDVTTTDWENYSTGLANVSVTELEMQYATNKLRACTYGRGVWESDAVVTTGAVLGTSLSSIDFGRIETGLSGDTLGITLTNYGIEDTLVISSIAVGGPPFILPSPPELPLILPPQASAAVAVTFSPTEHGDARDTLSIMSNSSSGAVLSIPFSGRGVLIGQAEEGVMYAANDSLFIVEISSGALSAVGETGVSEIQSLAVHGQTKELYGTNSDNLGTTVYRVSSGYGDALPVRTFPVPYLRAIAFGPENTLYAAAAYGLNAGQLFRLDVSTGTAEHVGTASVTYSSLAFNPLTGSLMASERPPVGTRDRIYRVNTETGNATIVGQTGFSLRVTAAIAFDNSASLYGVTGSGTQVNELIRIDTTTGAGVLIGSMAAAGVTAMTMRTDSLVLGVPSHTRPGIPESYVLEQNYPNPFNPSTEVRFGLPQQSKVSLAVFDILGKEVVRLHEGISEAGYHSVSWRGLDNAGDPVSSGVYFLRFEAAAHSGHFSSVRKMLLMK